MKVRYTNDYGQIVIIDLPEGWRLEKNFILSELANNLALESVKFISTSRSRKFLSMIQEFRTWYARSMTVTSNYRTPSFNDKCGGSKNSLHLDALALDWKANHNNTQRAKVRNKWADICKAHKEIGGINFYTHGYHMCIGEEKFGNTAFTVRDYRGRKGDW